MNKFSAVATFEKDQKNLDNVVNINESSVYLKDLNFSKIPENFNSFYVKKNFLHFKKKCIDKIYKHYLIHNNFKLLPRTFNQIICPFAYLFLDVMNHKIETLLNFKNQNRNSYFSAIKEKYYEYPENFSEFISKLQTDNFNLQLNSEIINYYQLESRNINFKFNLKKFLKKLNYLNNNYKPIINEDLSPKTIIKKKIFFYRLDHRHKFAINNLLKDKNFINLDLKKFKNIKLYKGRKNQEFRQNIKNNFQNKKEKFLFKMLVKYLPSLYLESIFKNIELFSQATNKLPLNIVSNPHGWWNDDHFKFYLALCLNNNAKYYDVQHNGSFFIFDENQHLEISKLFRSFFIGWGDSCLRQKNAISLPALYSVKKKIIRKQISPRKVIFLGANVSRYFEGYKNSVLSGGQHLSYFHDQVKFLKKISNEIIPNLIFRTRYNIKDPNNYKKILKKNFNQLKLEKINLSAHERLSDKNIKIIVVDHFSTPWLEALYVNKPTIIFYNKKQNNFSNRFKNILNELKKNKIVFDNSEDAAKWLNIIYKKNSSWWYKKKFKT